jgi:hypothetical protein
MYAASAMNSIEILEYLLSPAITRIYPDPLVLYVNFASDVQEERECVLLDAYSRVIEAKREKKHRSSFQNVRSASLVRSVSCFEP